MPDKNESQVGDTLRRGVANRRRVLGNAWVERALDLDTLKEVLLQTAVYAGVPAGNTGMAIVLQVLSELGRTPPPADFWRD